MQSIIQDGSDEMPLTVFEGAFPYKRSINEEKGFFAFYGFDSFTYTRIKCRGSDQE